MKAHSPTIIPKKGFKGEFDEQLLLKSFESQDILSVPRIGSKVDKNNIKDYLLVVSEPKAFKNYTNRLLKYGVFGLDQVGKTVYIDEFIYQNQPSKRIRMDQEVMALQGRYPFIKEEYVCPAGQLVLDLHPTYELQQKESFREFFCDSESPWNIFLQDWNLFMCSKLYKSVQGEEDLKELHSSAKLLFKPVLDYVWDYVKEEFDSTPLDMELGPEVRELASLHSKANNAMENIESKVYRSP